MDELQPLRDGPRFAGLSDAPVADRVFEIDEKPRLGAIVGFIDQHAALSKQRLKPFEHDIDQRIRAAGGRGQQFGLRLARR